MARNSEAGLDKTAAAVEAQLPKARGLPPVHLWNPAPSGDIDIVIRKDGSWTHEGAEIARPALVRLFSTILRRDGDEIFLVTPVEKWRLRVEDAPFLAVALKRDGPDLTFTTNVGDEVTAGPDNPIRVAVGEGGAPRPYVRVRGGLDALIARPVFYELVELASERNGMLGVESGGAWFPIGEAGW